MRELFTTEPVIKSPFSLGETLVGDCVRVDEVVTAELVDPEDVPSDSIRVDLEIQE